MAPARPTSHIATCRRTKLFKNIFLRICFFGKKVETLTIYLAGVVTKAVHYFGCLKDKENETSTKS